MPAPVRNRKIYPVSSGGDALFIKGTGPQNDVFPF